MLAESPIEVLTLGSHYRLSLKVKEVAVAPRCSQQLLSENRAYALARR